MFSFFIDEVSQIECIFKSTCECQVASDGINNFSEVLYNFLGNLLILANII